MENARLILLPDLTGSNILFTPTANKSVIYQKDLKKSRKKCFCFVNSSFVYETCGKLRCVHDEDPQKGKKRK